MRRLVEIVEEGRTVIRFVDDTPVARSTLPMPYVISDEIPPTEHVDGRFYTSKKKYRDLTRAEGLTEIGNEKLKPHVRMTDRPETKKARRAALKTALEKYNAGHRPRRAS
jgi:hypothetical protein